MALALHWNYKLDIKTTEDLFKLVNIYKTIKPNYSSIDTETNGLHIITNKPFLINFGFYNSETLEGATFTYDLERCTFHSDFFFTLYKICGKTIKCIFHNTKFDLHMLTNIGYPYPHKNVTDTQFYIRFSHDAITEAEGGVPLGLKSYAVRYILPNAKNFEAKLKEEQRQITKANTDKLVSMLRPLGIPPKEFMLSGREKYWTKAMVEEYLKDKTNIIEDLPDDVASVYKRWLDIVIDPNNYQNLNRENLTEYAHYDIIFTVEIFHKLTPMMKHRNQEDVLKIEEEVIFPLYEMERVGFNFNMEYALECKANTRRYILERRKQLCILAGQDIKVGQSQTIGKILKEKYNITRHATYHEETSETDWAPTSSSHIRIIPAHYTYSTGNDILDLILHEEISDEAREFIEVILELRTLEKWYSTYICKWIDNAVNGRVYTTINQVAAVSGRVSSDFQQFPSKPLLDNKGNVLFHPRRLVKVTGGDFDSIVYFDYSQIELRIQALYTILVKGGDRNLCRAYMPFECYTLDPLTNDRWVFNYNNENDLKTFKDYKWYHNEDDIEWHPTDLHSMTTHKAFPDVPLDSDKFKQLRKQGKSTNFACTYGANANTLQMQFHYPEEVAKALYNGYITAFPGILNYRNYVREYLMTHPSIGNLFRLNYYGANYHKCCNYLIQGSSAIFLKMKIIAIYKFLKEGNYKTRFQMNIHDEKSFEFHKDEHHLIPLIKELMEDLPGTKIPIVADVEITHTTWDEKEDYVA